MMGIPDLQSVYKSDGGLWSYQQKKFLKLSLEKDNLVGDGGGRNILIWTDFLYWASQQGMIILIQAGFFDVCQYRGFSSCSNIVIKKYFEEYIDRSLSF